MKEMLKFFWGVFILIIYIAIAIILSKIIEFPISDSFLLSILAILITIQVDEAFSN